MKNHEQHVTRAPGQFLWIGLSVFGYAGSTGHATLLCYRLDAVFKTPQAEKLTQAARNSSTAHSIDPNAKSWLITYATQTGMSEQLAWRTATSLQEARQPVTVKPIQQLHEADLKQAEHVLFVVSTYGTGEAQIWPLVLLKS